MAMVYKAQHTRLGSVVAIKVMLANLAQNEKARHRFQQEAYVQHQLDHPNIVKVHDVIDVGQSIGIVMEYVEGPTLEAWLKANTGVKSEAEVMMLMAPVISAMAYSHGREVVHRDLKPANILLHQDADGSFQPKVTDFGLVKVLADSTGMTRQGTVMGTMPYMSPEQAAGRKGVDARTDIFALGVIWWHMQTGRLPVNPENFHATADFYAGRTPVPQLQGALSGVVAQAMSLDPAGRPANAADLQERWRSKIEGKSAAAAAASDADWLHTSDTTGASVHMTPPTATKKKRSPLVTIGALVGAAALLYFFVLKPSHEEKLISDCEKGTASACQELVVMYQDQLLDESEGLSKEDEDALGEKIMRYLEEGCAHKGGESCAELGRVYANGIRYGVTKNTTKAEGLFEQACDADHYETCKKLGDKYGGPFGEVATALKYWDKACQGGDVFQACARAANVYTYNTSFKDHKKARSLFRKACDGNYAAACSALGMMYHLGQGGTVDFEGAFALYKKGCDEGDALGCTQLGSLYETGKGIAAVDFGEARRLYLKGCDGQNWYGCYKLGTLNEFGIGASPDLYKARSLYTQACDKKVGAACQQLGLLYANGKGVSKNDYIAFNNYEKACDVLHYPGCTSLGHAYSGGKGTKKNLYTAKYYFKTSCDGGSLWGCVGLAMAYEFGNGVRRNYSKAFELYQRACDANVSGGCDGLGWLYRDGKGVSRNRATARSFFKKGCELGNQSSCSEQYK